MKTKFCFFYSGLGLALASAGVMFTRNYLLYGQVIAKEYE